MKYKVAITNQELILDTNNSEAFFKQFVTLPEGEYTVQILSDKRRSGKHSRGFKIAPWVSLLLDVAAVLMCFGTIIAMWIIVCSLI